MVCSTHAHSHTHTDSYTHTWWCNLKIMSFVFLCGSAWLLSEAGSAFGPLGQLSVESANTPHWRNAMFWIQGWIANICIQTHNKVQTYLELRRIQNWDCSSYFSISLDQNDGFALLHRVDIDRLEIGAPKHVENKHVVVVWSFATPFAPKLADRKETQTWWKRSAKNFNHAPEIEIT